MKKIKQLFSFVLICATVLGTLSVYAQEPKDPPSVGEKLQMAEEIREILREVGVGTVEGYEEIPRAEFAAKSTIYAQVLEANVGAIDIVDYNQTAPDGTPWVILEHWNEGRLGTSSGEELYCANPTVSFRAGYKTAVDAAKYYNKATIQMIAAMFYYYDHYACSGINSNYDYLFKQCAVWWVLNEAHHWYGNVVIETGNNVKCNLGHWLATHKSEYMTNGMAWARKNYQYFQDAYGIMYEGAGQPLSKWGGTYKLFGTVRLKKESANPSVTTQNGNYSLEGAEFGVYKEASLSGSSRVGVLKTDAKGDSNVLSLQVGTYFVKEIKAPKGYALNPETKTVTISSGRESTVMFEDVPQLCPIEILLRKTDADTGENKPQGAATFRGARFTVKYYDGLWEEDTDPEKLGKTAKRTWVFETDEDGQCSYGKKHLVSGDALYVDLNGRPAVPIGTVTIQETKAPEGYLLNPELFVRQITAKGNTESVDTYNTLGVPERILKLDLIKRQEGLDVPIPGVKFEHESPDGTKETIETDQNGELTLKGLQYGTHKIQEISVMDGYLLNGNVIEFYVAQDNQISITSKIDDTLGKAEIQVTDKGNIIVTMEDPLAPFRLLIHKENQKGRRLEGAEFTLYAEKTCENVVMRGETGTDGVLELRNLEVGKRYYMKETKAPEGYRIPVDLFGNPLVYELWVESIPAKDTFLFYVNGKAYDASDSDGMFSVGGTKADRETHVTVINETGMKLPDTGSKWMLPMLAAGGILCLVAGRQQKRKKIRRIRR